MVFKFFIWCFHIFESSSYRHERFVSIISHIKWLKTIRWIISSTSWRSEKNRRITFINFQNDIHSRNSCRHWKNFSHSREWSWAGILKWRSYIFNLILFNMRKFVRKSIDFIFVNWIFITKNNFQNKFCNKFFCQLSLFENKCCFTTPWFQTWIGSNEIRKCEIWTDFRFQIQELDSHRV